MKKTVTTIFTYVLGAASVFATQPSSNLTAEQALQKADKQFFIENKGQWPNQVLFLYQNNGLNTWITKKGMVHDFYTIREEENSTRKIGHVVSITNLNAQENVITQAENKQQAYYNFFMSNDQSKWASNVGLYKEVTTKSIYNGIDIRYYFDKNTLRYDYIVHPGANPAQIQIKLDGANAYSINNDGDLVFNTCLGEVKLKDLYTYQMVNGSKKTVASAFKINGETIQFDVKNYDKTKPLIIDPLVWSTYIGGSGDDRIYSVVEKNGNAFISGWTSQFPPIDFPTTPGSYNTSLNNTTRAFVSKFSNDGSSLVFSTFLGSVSNSGGGNIHADGVFLDVDSNGDCYITGIGQNGYPTTPGVFNNTATSGVFVTKLNNTGTSLVYSTFVGGDTPRAIAVDNQGYAYITGRASSGLPTTPGAFDQTNNGFDDAFVTKVNTDGSTLIFSTFIGGSGQFEDAFAIKVDANHDVYIAGRTSSPNFPTTSGCYDATFNGGSGPFPYDIFVSKLNNTGSALIFSTFIGGSQNEEAYGIDIDANNNVYITGYTESTDFPVTAGVYQTTKGSGKDAFIAKLNSTGSSLDFASYFGVGSSQEAYGITLDGNNNVWIVGRTGGSATPVTNDAFDNTLNGENSFVVAFNNSATSLVYGSYIGGSGMGGDIAKSITNDHAGGFYVAGWTHSIDLPVTTGAFQTTNNSLVAQYREGFVLKFQHGSPTSISQYSVEYLYHIFPNPNKGAFTIQSTKAGVFELIDVTGKLMNTYIITNTQQTVNENLAAGIYFVREKESGSVQKLMIE
jgi:hypothetical protein